MAKDRRVINFAAGPAKVPEEVLRQAQDELLDYKGTGVSVMELSHRSPTFEKIIGDAETDLRELMSIPSNYKVLFVSGGGTGQFAAIPLNLCNSLKDSADYFVTGAWSAKAVKEAGKYCTLNKVIPKVDKHVNIADASSWKFDSSASYIYYCDNETIDGVEFQTPPESPNQTPLVCDMTSSFLTKVLDVSKFGVIMAGAQKNVGIGGLTIVIVREDLINNPLTICPSVLDYKVMSDNKSLYNTPPCYPIYITGLFLKWVKAKGGVEGMAERCKTRSQMVYNTIDSSNGFYYSPVDKKYRSRVTIPFRVGGSEGNEALEKKFLVEAGKRDMIQLKGHRSVGGIRACLYNAMTVQETQVFVDFMKEFMKENGQK